LSFFFFVIARISLVHLKTNDKSTFKEPLILGVPTQIKIISDTVIAFFKSEVKYNLLDL